MLCIWQRLVPISNPLLKGLTDVYNGIILVYKLMIPYIGTIGAGLTAQALAARDFARKEPYANSPGSQGSPVFNSILEATDRRITDQGYKSPDGVGFKEVVPENYRDAFANANNVASNSRRSDGDNYNVSYNPNADKVYLAHELGHIVSDRTPMGNKIRSARGNPALSKALSQAAYLLPGTIAAVNPGDDDLGLSVVAGLAASAPVIADELLASKNALAIMDSAGMRASMGQRGKLAGGLLTYIAAPVFTAVVANKAGNLMDDELVGQQTSGTASM